MFPKLRRLLKLGDIPYLLGIAKLEEPNNDKFKEKCAELEQSLKLTKERLQCIMNVLQNQVDPKLYELHTTDKGVPVLVSIDPRGGKVKVFNINNNPDGRYLLRLDAQYENNDVEIVNIGGGIGLGHGKIAVERFVHHCINNGIEKVFVRYSPPDKTHETRFINFFTKCGFQAMERLPLMITMQKIL